MDMATYSQDFLELLEIYDECPLIAQFGDVPSSLYFPVFAKFRGATTRELLHHVTQRDCLQFRSGLVNSVTSPHMFSPIIWKLKIGRHFNPLMQVGKWDIPWERKINKAIWRGTTTGDIYGANDEEKCKNNPRCRFVLDNIKSKLIDAGITKLRLLNTSIMHGVDVAKRIMNMSSYLEHKMIISLEGNDVATGLKWNLFSQSVVIMPPPTRTSWAMEELLEPWVHYVPLYPDASNAEEMAQWVIDNDDKARTIAERGTLFMYDLAFHPDAASEERQIKKEITRRYRALWR